MKNQTLTIAAVILVFAAASAFAATGEELYKQHCASCHPDGGNIIKPKYTLHKKDMDREGVKGAKGIIKLIRKPEAGMTAFDKKTISDKDAQAIAEYVLKTFK